jgi:hypothetical protein
VALRDVQKTVRLAMADALRRWADRLEPRDSAARNDAGLSSTIDDESPAAFSPPEQERRRVDQRGGGPPAHWIERVRDAAPQLLEPQPNQPGGGPPAHWIERVRQAAPRLLQPEQDSMPPATIDQVDVQPLPQTTRTRQAVALELASRDCASAQSGKAPRSGQSVNFEASELPAPASGSSISPESAFLRDPRASEPIVREAISVRRTPDGVATFAGAALPALENQQHAGEFEALPIARERQEFEPAPRGCSDPNEPPIPTQGRSASARLARLPYPDASGPTRHEPMQDGPARGGAVTCTGPGPAPRSLETEQRAGEFDAWPIARWLEEFEPEPRCRSDRNRSPVPTNGRAGSAGSTGFRYPEANGPIGLAPMQDLPASGGDATCSSPGPLPRSLETAEDARESGAWPIEWKSQELAPEPRGFPRGAFEPGTSDRDTVGRSERVDPWPELPQERWTRSSEAWREAQIQAARRRKLDLEQMGMPWNE